MRDRLARMSRGGVAASFATLVLAAVPSAQAADDGYANVFSSIFSAVGVIKADPEPDIAYRERPQLVLPPQPGLPKPADGVRRTAAWPKDPDVVRHRKDLEAARAPQGNLVNDRNDIANQAELAKGRGTSAAFEPNGCSVNGNNRTCLLVSPDELKAESDRFLANNPNTTDEVVAGQEPSRDFLTQPPKGYLKATRTVKATAEAPARQVDPSNPRAFMRPQQKTDE